MSPAATLPSAAIERTEGCRRAVRCRWVRCYRVRVAHRRRELRRHGGLDLPEKLAERQLRQRRSPPALPARRLHDAAPSSPPTIRPPACLPWFAGFQAAIGCLPSRRAQHRCRRCLIRLAPRRYSVVYRTVSRYAVTATPISAFSPPHHRQRLPPAPASMLRHAPAAAVSNAIASHVAFAAGSAAGHRR